MRKKNETEAIFMQEILVRTKGNASAKGKPKVYFACHSGDLGETFDRVCADLFEAADCAVYYTADMAEELPMETREIDLGRMNLFVFPVTQQFLTEPNRAHDSDLAFAKRENKPILPLMFGAGLDQLYARSENFGKRQYLTPGVTDPTAIPYAEKLKKYLEEVLLDADTVGSICRAFDARMFLSYRKADRAYANALMRRIHADPRYRFTSIWFDEFLTPGEAFDDEIVRAIRSSDLFLLAVTPTLLENAADGKPNYVVTHEYPSAKRAADAKQHSALVILPVCMKKLHFKERFTLRRKFPGLPGCVDFDDSEELEDVLRVRFQPPVRKAGDDPEHLYLIGLAYLNGIRVECDAARGVKMLTQAGELGHLKAMLKLCELYHKGDHVPLDWRKEAEWREKLYLRLRKANGENDPLTLTCLNNLALTLDLCGDYRRALELNENLYAVRCRVLGEEHPDTLTTLSNLGMAYSRVGEQQRAKEVKEKAYAICRRVLGENHPTTLTALSNLAVTYRALGSTTESDHLKTACETAEKAYKVRCETLGEEHPDTLMSLNNLAVTCSELGDHSRALELYEKAYALRCKVLGKNHPDTLSGLSDLAVERALTGDRRGSHALLEQIFAADLETLGEEHPGTVEVMKKLASSAGELGDYRREAELNEKLLPIFRRTVGEGHPDTLTCINRLAIAYGNLGRTREAKELFETGYGLRRRYLGEENPGTLIGLSNLVSVSIEAGDYSLAIGMGEAGLPLFRKVCGEEHPDTVNFSCCLAEAYAGAGEAEKALDLCERIAFGSICPSYPIARRAARIYIRLGKHDKASEALKRGRMGDTTA